MSRLLTAVLTIGRLSKRVETSTPKFIKNRSSIGGKCGSVIGTCRAFITSWVPFPVMVPRGDKFP